MGEGGREGESEREGRKGDWGTQVKGCSRGDGICSYSHVHAETRSAHGVVNVKVPQGTVCHTWLVCQHGGTFLWLSHHLSIMNMSILCQSQLHITVHVPYSYSNILSS